MNPNPRTRDWAFLGLGILILTFAPATVQQVYAQVDTGAILGTVKDQTGAVVPAAKVTITNEGTGLTLSTLTRDDGGYIFTPLKIGKYTVEVEYSGFKRARRLSIEVNIQDHAVVDFVLEPGELTQTLEVTAAAPLLQTQSGSVGEGIGAKTINDLPLSGRNYTFLGSAHCRCHSCPGGWARFECHRFLCGQRYASCPEQLSAGRHRQ